MASLKSLIFPSLTGLALCAISSAQAGSAPVQALQAQKFEGGITGVRAQQVVDENGNLSWDYTVLGGDRATHAGGTLSQAAPGQRKALVSCFQNTITNGFFSVGTNGTEWMDWAIKKANKTGIVGAFAFAYASNARGSSQPGGTGASIGVSFYSGTTGFCSRGTRVSCPFFFTGLPGATGTQVSPGFTVTAVLSKNKVFCLPDGKIGWSYFFNEPPMGTNQNATGPLLSGLNSNTCWADAFDLWSSPDPVASCAGVFFFGGCIAPLTFAVPNPCAGFWIKIFEETGSAASSSVFNNTCGVPNPIRYSEVQSANIGEQWITNILLVAPEFAGLIYFGTPGVLNLCGVPLWFGGSRHMVFGGTPILCPVGPNPVVHTLLIPKDLSLIGSIFHTQGFAVRSISPFQMQALNGITITIGAI